MLVKKKTKKGLKNELKKWKKLKFSMKSLTFLCLICALNLYFENLTQLKKNKIIIIIIINKKYYLVLADETCLISSS